VFKVAAADLTDLDWMEGWEAWHDLGLTPVSGARALRAGEGVLWTMVQGVEEVVCVPVGCWLGRRHRLLLRCVVIPCMCPAGR
jgi:hypothetical protein